MEKSFDSNDIKEIDGIKIGFWTLNPGNKEQNWI